MNSPVSHTRRQRRAAAAPLAAAVAVLAGVATPASAFTMRDFDVKLSVTMRSSFSFRPNPTGCNGQLPLGYTGSGQEILQASSPRPVRLTYVDDGGTAQPTLSRRDLKSAFAIEGTTTRSASLTATVCQPQPPLRLASCVGRHRFADAIELAFMSGTRFVFSSARSKPTTAVVKGCDRSGFNWDSAVARTGNVLLLAASGRTARSRLARSRSAVTLRAHAVERCDVPDFGLGSCRTEWSYAARFTPVKRRTARR